MNRWSFRILCILSIICLTAHDNYGQLLPTVDRTWTTNYDVSTSAHDSQYLYIGGDFTFIGPNNSSQAIVTNSSSNPIKNLPYVEGTIKKSIPDGSGGYYIAGEFSIKVGATSIRRLAHILADGNVDPSWNPNPNDSVLALDITNDFLYVGGHFTQIGGQSINYCSRLNVSTAVPDISWNPNPNGAVKALLVDGADIYVGGQFTFIGGEFNNYVAKLNSSGNLNTSWLPSIMVQSGRYVNNIKKLGSHIYIAGFFIATGNTVWNIARVDMVNGSFDINWKPAPNGFINTFEFSGGFAYVYGNFTSIGGKNRLKVAKINLVDGQSDAIWNPLKTSSISALTVGSGEVYIAKYRDSTRKYFPSRITKLDTISGSEILGWEAYLEGFVSCFSLYNSEVFVGGNFKMLGGYPSNKIAKINLGTWSPDTTWNPSPDGAVRLIKIEDQSIYVTGIFNNIGNKSRYGTARLNKNDGSVDSLWNPRCWFPSRIYIANSHIYFVGSFTQVGGVTRNGLARVDKVTGSLDLNWNPSPVGQVSDILVRGEGVYAGGTFTSIGGIPKRYLGKLNLSTGAAYPNWGIDLNGSVFSLVEKDSNLYLGGTFQQIGGVNISNLARIKTSNAELDSNWKCNVSGEVGLMKLRNNNLYITGSFNQIGGSNYNKIAKINILSRLPDSRLKLSMRINDHFRTFEILETTDSTEIIAGGGFWEINGMPRFNLASFKLANQLPSTPVLSEPADNSTNLSQPIILKWQSDVEVDEYIVEVSESENFGSIAFVDSSVVDTLVVLPLMENDKYYYWRVKGKNAYGQGSSSTIWKFRTLGFLPILTQLQPINQSVNVPVDSVLFEWSIPGLVPNDGEIKTNSPTPFSSNDRLEENVTFLLEVATDTASGSAFFIDSTITTTSTRLSGFSYLTNYYWRVRGRNPLGWNSFSPWSKFTTVIERPEQPILVSPANRDSGIVQPASLIWNSSQRADHYILQIGLDPFFTNLVFVDSLNVDTTRIIPELPRLTWFYWRVIAKNNGGFSDTSDVWQFKTQGTPSVVTLLLPRNYAEWIPITNALFKWTKAKDLVEAIQAYRFELVMDTTQQNYTLLDTLLTDTVKIVSGLSYYTTYYWRVGAKNEAGWGNFTPWYNFTTVREPINAPTNLVAVPETIGKVKLNWSDNSGNELGFIILRKLGDSLSTSDLMIVDTVQANITEFLDSLVTDTTLYSYLVQAYSNDTLSLFSNFASVMTLTNIKEFLSGVPTEFMLFQNFPNPFNPSTQIRFGLPSDSYVVIELFSVQGELLFCLLREERKAGYYEVKLELPALSSGIYLYRVIANSHDGKKTFTATRKLILMK